MAPTLSTKLPCLAALLALACAYMAVPCMGSSKLLQPHQDQLQSTAYGTDGQQSANSLTSAATRHLQQASPTPSPSSSPAPSPSSSPTPSPSPSPAKSPSPQPAWPSPSPNTTTTSPNMTSPNMTSPSPAPSPAPGPSPAPSPPPPISVQMSMFLGGVNSTQFAALAAVFKSTTMQLAFGPNYANSNAVQVNSFVDYTYTGNFTNTLLPSPSPSPGLSPSPATSNTTSPSPATSNTTSPSLSPAVNSTSPSPSPVAPAGRRSLAAMHEEEQLSDALTVAAIDRSELQTVPQIHRVLQQTNLGVLVNYSLVEASTIVGLAVLNLKTAIENGTYTAALQTAGIPTTGAKTVDPNASPLPASPLPSPPPTAFPSPSPAPAPAPSDSSGRTYSPREVATITVCTTVGAVLFVILLALAWHWGRHLFCPSSPVQPQAAAPPPGVSGVTAMSALKPTMPPYPPSPYRPPGGPYQPPGSPYGHALPMSPARLPLMTGYSPMQPVNMYQPDWAVKPAGVNSDSVSTPTKTIPAVMPGLGYGQLPPLQAPALPPLPQHLQQAQQQIMQQQAPALPPLPQHLQQQIMQPLPQHALQQLPAQQQLQAQQVPQAAGYAMQQIMQGAPAQVNGVQSMAPTTMQAPANATTPLMNGAQGYGNSTPGYAVGAQGQQAPAYR